MRISAEMQTTFMAAVQGVVSEGGTATFPPNLGDDGSGIRRHELRATIEPPTLTNNLEVVDPLSSIGVTLMVDRLVLLDDELIGTSETSGDLGPGEPYVANYGDEGVDAVFMTLTNLALNGVRDT